LSLIIDAHEDIAWNTLCYGRDYLQSAKTIRAREAGGPVEATTGVAMLGLPEWLAGNVAVVFGTLYTKPARKSTSTLSKGYNTPQEAYVLGTQEIDIYRRMADQSEQIKLINTRSDLEAVLKTWDGGDPAKRQVGIVMLMENGDPIRTPEEVSWWYEHGLRLVGPAWAGTRYCGGTAEPGPLTDLGVRLLKAMSNLNMVLDTTHMAEQSFFQALDRYEGPVIASHSNPRVFMGGGDRHLSDDMIRALINHDGVIGTVVYNRFLIRDWKSGDPKDAANVDTVVERIDYVCQKAGNSQHAAIGTDFDGGFGVNSAPAGFDTVADLKIIGDKLKEKGYKPEDVDLIMSGNWLRVLQRSLPA
jgi:membrane dipeptidase